MFRIRKALSVLMIIVTPLLAQSIPVGKTLPQSDAQATLWWASSGWKIKPDSPLPTQTTENMSISLARNESEAVQLIITPKLDLSDVRFEIKSPMNYNFVELLRVRFVTTAIATDGSTQPGDWPDPLPPIREPLSLAANRNSPFWIRVSTPRQVPAGTYDVKILVKTTNKTYPIPLRIQVFDFTLPDRMTCKSAFGFSPNNVFRYHKLDKSDDKRAVLDKYLQSFAGHHISPYNPAPLDPIQVTWPDVKPPASRYKDWDNLRLVDNESHSGVSSALLYDDNNQLNVTTAFQPQIMIPAQGLRLSFWYRTALPDHRFLITLNHFDQNGNWISGHNNDLVIKGNGKWQQFDQLIKNFPANAESVRLYLRAARWTDEGELLGLVWIDELSLKNAVTGDEYISMGDFEPEHREELVCPPDKLTPRIDFAQWDIAMKRAIDHYHFNTFQLHIPGTGGGTFHELFQPSLLGFGLDTPEYPILFNSYARQIEQHLKENGWLDEAFIYWFDEPDPDQYPFVKAGFDRLKAACPGIDRMLTEQPEPALYGGPNIYCVISNLFDPERASQRLKAGDRFWWYICTGPKAPYCTLFIDHPGTELRVWLWQTWQRQIEGILIWETNYWTSSAAYPDTPQNPYEDPMGWVSGYSTPSGIKRPWGNGDGRFIYPPESAANANPTGPVLDGPVDSIRWEMLRDGIEDYEYFSMLKKLLAERKSQISPARYQQYASLLEVPESVTADLTHFTLDPAQIENHRALLAHAIEELSNKNQ